MMNEAQKRLLIALSEPIEIIERPFLKIAKRLNTTENRVLGEIRELSRRKVIRRFGAMLGHRRIGLKANVLVAWSVRRPRVKAAASKLTAYPQVSHCYLRKSYRAWPYNLYTMIHASDRKEGLALIKRMADEAKIQEYKALFTVKEFKKSKADLAKLLDL